MSLEQAVGATASVFGDQTSLAPSGQEDGDDLDEENNKDEDVDNMIHNIIKGWERIIGIS